MISFVIHCQAERVQSTPLLSLLQALDFVVFPGAEEHGGPGCERFLGSLRRAYLEDFLRISRCGFVRGGQFVSFEPVYF